MIEMLFYSRNTLLIEGFRTVLASYPYLAFITAGRFPSRVSTGSHHSIVVVDSQLIPHGALGYLHQLTDQNPQALLVSNSVEMDELGALLPSRVRLINSELSRGVLVGQLRRFIGSFHRMAKVTRETELLSPRETEVLRHVDEDFRTRRLRPLAASPAKL